MDAVSGEPWSDADISELEPAGRGPLEPRPDGERNCFRNMNRNGGWDAVQPDRPPDPTEDAGPRLHPAKAGLPTNVPEEKALALGHPGPPRPAPERRQHATNAPLATVDTVVRPVLIDSGAEICGAHKCGSLVRARL
jgi:hypothetical protein